MYASMNLGFFRSWARWCWMVLLVARATAAVPAPVDFTGTWKWAITNANNQAVEYSLRLKQEGEKLTGVFVRDNNEWPVTDLTTQGDELRFRVVRKQSGREFLNKYVGKIHGDKIAGKMEFERDGETRNRSWEAALDPKAPRPKSPAAASLNGTWKYTITTADNTKLDFSVELKQEGEKVSGTFKFGDFTRPVTEGHWKDGEVTFIVTGEYDNQPFKSEYHGKLANGVITGKIQSNHGGKQSTHDWNAKRE